MSICSCQTHSCQMVCCGTAVLRMNVKHSIFINPSVLCVSTNPRTTPPLSNPAKPFQCLKIKRNPFLGKTPWLLCTNNGTGLILTIIILCISDHLLLSGGSYNSVYGIRISLLKYIQEMEY